MGKQECPDMYYNRKMSDPIAGLLKEGGQYHWLIEYVKKREDLDFQTGRNSSSSWFSVYRGLGSLLKITGVKSSPKAAGQYEGLFRKFYSNPSSKDFDKLIDLVQATPALHRYYDNKKEGYYQNMISRRYGIQGNADDDFIIFDKEFIFGYKNTETKDKILKPLKEKYFKLHENPLGNECDFIALNQKGEILLMELKNSLDTQKIYLSPFQLGMYCDIYNEYIKRFGLETFQQVVFEIIKQKQELGLLNKDWKIPSRITGLKAVLIVGGNPSPTAVLRFAETRKKVAYPIETYSVKGNRESDFFIKTI